MVRSNPNQSADSKERQRTKLVNLLHGMARSQLGTVVRKFLGLVHPFELQRAEYPNERFLVVHDSMLVKEKLDATLKALAHGEPYLVWVDLSRLRPVDWHGLPPWFVTFEQRSLQIVWNHFQELNHHQLDRLSVRPVMLHQFGQRIASLWKDETGRLPRVRVYSYVMLHYRFPQPLIDPEIDLARTSFELLGHNEWILPLEGERLSELHRKRPPAVTNRPNEVRRR